jgi:hypothetical protein
MTGLGGGARDDRRSSETRSEREGLQRSLRRRTGRSSPSWLQRYFEKVGGGPQLIVSQSGRPLGENCGFRDGSPTLGQLAGLGVATLQDNGSGEHGSGCVDGEEGEAVPRHHFAGVGAKPEQRLAGG